MIIFITESELRLSQLVAVKQKYSETAFDYMRRFRDTRNKCYGLTIREKDLAGFCRVIHVTEGQNGRARFFRCQSSAAAGHGP
jgi:hypothetical protein